MKSLLKSRLIKAIVSLELNWFKTLKTEQTYCQENEESFKRIRSVTFQTWSLKTLFLYWRYLVSLKKEGRNPVAEKYLIMDGRLPGSTRRIIKDIVEIESGWMDEVRREYPSFFKDDLSSFKRYLSAELSTYSDEVLASYMDDLNNALENGRNLVKERYEFLARSLSFSSLAEMAGARK